MTRYEKNHIASVVASADSLTAAAKELAITLKHLLKIIVHDSELRSSICAAKRYYGKV